MLRILILAIALSIPVQASTPKSPAPLPRLTDVQRSRLREKLYDFWSDVNLSIRNQKINRYDVGRQEREMGQMQVFGKMPLAHCPRALEEGVRKSARIYGIYLSRLRITRRPGSARPLPRKLYVDEGGFHIAENQLVDTYVLNLTLQGLESSLKDWSAAWVSLSEPSSSTPSPTSPYLERSPLAGAADSSPWRKVPSPSVIPRWTARLQGYCFRDLSFPKLILRDPVALLPAWVRRNPEQFAKDEPDLWALVEKTRALIPDARPLYATRERFLLNDARLSFFLHKMEK